MSRVSKFLVAALDTITARREYSRSTGELAGLEVLWRWAEIPTTLNQSRIPADNQGDEHRATCSGTSAGPSASRDSSNSSIQGCPSGRLLEIRVDGTSDSETANAVANLATSGAGGMVCAADVHMVMEAFGDPSFRRTIDSADRVTPNRVSLIWALRNHVAREYRVGGSR